MHTQSTHFNLGTLEVAFVFSAPGTKEDSNNRPVSGATGKNLNFALAYLSRNYPSAFPSSDRYAYRITNAYSSAISVGLGSNRSEATSTEILEPNNVLRVVDELHGCRLVILCGNKAQLLQGALKQAGFRVACESHTSNQGLVSKHNTLIARAGASPEDRRRLRAEAWASSLQGKLATEGAV